MFGLKINFHKSVVYVFWVSQQEKERLANMLNYNLGSWPMKYLGIPISDQRLGVAAFLVIKHKMRKKLDPRKGKCLSSGGQIDPYQHLSYKLAHVCHEFLSVAQANP
jgi:hypothetical protein